MSNQLSFEDLPSERFIYFYTHFLHYALFMASVSCFTTVFVILRASNKAMGRYKWFLLNEVLWSYLFDIILIFWTPIPCFPYQCGYSVGLLSNSSPFAMQLVVKVIVAAAIGKGFSIYIAILHRNIQVLPPSRFQSHYKQSRRLHKVYFVILLIIELVIVTPIHFAEIGDQAAVKQEITSQSSVMLWVYSKEPSIVCYKLNPEAIAAYGLAFTAVSSAVCAMPLVLIHMLFWIVKSRKTLTRSTFRTQWMLFLSIIFQVAVAFILLVVPFYLGIVLDLGGYRNAPIFIPILICFCSMHSTVDCLIIIMCIRPYRRYVLGFFNRRSRKLSIAPELFMLSSLAERDITRFRRTTI